MTSLRLPWEPCQLSRASLRAGGAGGEGLGLPGLAAKAELGWPAAALGLRATWPTGRATEGKAVQSERHSFQTRPAGHTSAQGQPGEATAEAVLGLGSLSEGRSESRGPGPEASPLRLAPLGGGVLFSCDGQHILRESQPDESSEASTYSCSRGEGGRFQEERSIFPVFREPRPGALMGPVP